MNSEGAIEWSRITGANIHKRIAIMLDGVVLVAPIIMSKITNGSCRIGGMTNLDEAKIYRILLKSGPLPLSLELVSENTIENKTKNSEN